MPPGEPSHGPKRSTTRICLVLGAFVGSACLFGALAVRGMNLALALAAAVVIALIAGLGIR